MINQNENLCKGIMKTVSLYHIHSGLLNKFLKIILYKLFSRKNLNTSLPFATFY